MPSFKLHLSKIAQMARFRSAGWAGGGVVRAHPRGAGATGGTDAGKGCLQLERIVERGAVKGVGRMNNYAEANNCILAGYGL